MKLLSRVLANLYLRFKGYGATTLPALTEAITEKKGEKQVKHEINRLVELIGKLAERIRP
jgi:N-acetylated-alpha-linked acidic dipeptidase